MNDSRLNEEQQKAVEETEGYVRVIAGAGTGKTMVLVSRYLYLVETLGIDPETILCLTFTRKARFEMLDRIRERLGEDSPFSYVLTYHSFGSLFLKEEIRKISYPPSFRIYDEKDTRKVLEQIYDSYERDLDSFQLEEIRSRISEYKSDGKYITLMIERGNKDHILPQRRNFEKIVIDNYLISQRKGRWLDFDDLILYTDYILKNYPGIEEKWQNRFSYIEVDEAQDTTRAEYDILERLAGRNHNLFLVGDPDQNIYEWRNSDQRILLDFDKRHKDSKTFILKENYRSTPEILEAANRLISNNHERVEKELVTVKGHGLPVEMKFFDTQRQEADEIIKRIKESILRNENYSDNAVLFRCAFLSETLETRLREEQIPYKTAGTPSFYDLSEIKDTIALIKIVLEEDDASLIRMINRPTRHFSKKKTEYLLTLQGEEPLLTTLKKNRNDIEFTGSEIKEFLNQIETIQEHLDDWPVVKTLNHLVSDTGYLSYVSGLKNTSHLENLQSFLMNIRHESEVMNPQPTLKEYYLSTLKRRIEETREKNHVSLLTIHASKGLEFKNVYLIGLVEPFFPHYKAVDERNGLGLEEERRLLYVGMTRAKDRLFLSYEKGTGYQGKPSMFLKEIFQENMTEEPEEKKDSEPLKTKGRKKKNQKKTKPEEGSLLSLFDNMKKKSSR